MDELLKTLASPAWWVTAVVFGLVINLVSAYIKPPIDGLLSRISERWRQRTEEARSKDKREIEALAINPQAQGIQLLLALRARSKSNGWLLVAILFIVMYSSERILYAIGLVAKVPVDAGDTFSIGSILIKAGIVAAAVAAIQKPATGDAFEDGYSYGYRLWESKFYPEAQVQLQETVSKYPKHKRVSYARNLLGRAWLDEGKPATAVKIFYDNYKNDPKGDRAPESLYFLGDALTDLNKAAEACEAFGQLASAYPAEASGRLAARLAEGRKKAKCK